MTPPGFLHGLRTATNTALLGIEPYFDQLFLVGINRFGNVLGIIQDPHHQATPLGAGQLRAS